MIFVQDGGTKGEPVKNNIHDLLIDVDNFLKDVFGVTSHQSPFHFPDNDSDSNFGNPGHSLSPPFHDEFKRFDTWNGHSGWDVVGGPQWADFPFKTASGSVFADRVTTQGTFPFNNEKGYYLNPTSTFSPFSVHDGILDIRATPTPQVVPGVDVLPYTTGMINSYHSHSQLYGYFEIRAELPSASGFLPAFWLLPTDGSHGEIDIMEVATNDLTHLHTTVHSFASGATTPISTSGVTTIPDASQSFHTYGIDWEADKITWYFDGVKIFETATPSDLHKPMYMFANLAVGGATGGWVGNPDGVSSADFKIDYIHAYPTGGPAVIDSHLDQHTGAHANGWLL